MERQGGAEALGGSWEHSIIPHRDDAGKPQDESAQDVRRRLVADVGGAITLVIEEIESAIAASRHKLEIRLVNLLSNRLAGLTAQARMAIARLSEPERDTSDRQCLERTVLETENRVREELHDLMHGPILGRLSSCAMALNFLAAESDTVPNDRITVVITAVLRHLDQTTHDLSLLRR